MKSGDQLLALARNVDQMHLNYIVSFGKRDQLGEGNFGKVFKAKNRADGQNIACKVVEKVDLDLSDMNNEDLVDLKKETNTIMELDHPNITKYYDCYEDDEKFYIMMELAAGGSLLNKIKEI